MHIHNNKQTQTTTTVEDTTAEPTTTDNQVHEQAGLKENAKISRPMYMTPAQPAQAQSCLQEPPGTSLNTLQGNVVVQRNFIQVSSTWRYQS